MKSYLVKAADCLIRILGFGLMVFALWWGAGCPVAPVLAISMIIGISGYIMATFGCSSKTLHRLDLMARIMGIMMLFVGINSINNQDYRELGLITGGIGLILIIGGIRYKRNFNYLRSIFSR